MCVGVVERLLVAIEIIGSISLSLSNRRYGSKASHIGIADYTLGSSCADRSKHESSISVPRIRMTTMSRIEPFRQVTRRFDRQVH